MRIKGKRNKQLVVQIPGMLVAAIEIEPELVELPSTGSGTEKKRSLDVARDDIRERPSKDVEGDKKLLYEHAHRVLFEITGRYQENEEYYLLMSEIKRARARLASFKGFTPATEAELALPMYMAAVALGEDVDKSRERLEKAIARLKDTSKLKAKCLDIMQKCNN
jgi:hypothetical protein